MNLLTYILTKLIKFYSFFISPMLRNSCRCYPSCSEYSIEALKEFGLIKGIFKSFIRILSCNPWGKAGLDPVKKEMKVKK